MGALAQTKTIKGKVSLDNTPLKDVSISILDTQNGVASAADGSYQIKVNEGDVIRYSYIGLKTIEILVEDVTNILNITLYPVTNELDEVVVTDKLNRVKIVTQQDYDENKTHLRTSFGMTDLSQSSGTVRFLQGKRISPGSTNVLEALRGVLPGVIVYGSPAVGIKIRGFNSITRPSNAIYDLDGVVFTDPPLWVIPSNVERIAVLSGVAATVKYGALGSGGVVVINTKQNIYLEGGSADSNSDTARLTDNMYVDDTVDSETLASGSKYLLALQKPRTLNEAKAAYIHNQKVISGSYFFVLDAFEYFLNERNDIEFAKKVLDDNVLVLQNNPVALKSLAYIYDAAGQYKEANEVYKEIFMLRPQYAQSYVDMARSYRAMGEYQRAAAMLVRNDYLVAEGFLQTDEHFSKVTDREMNNLLQLKGKTLISSKSERKYVLDDGFVGTRLVFEWADSEAEFDLQFVNPENRYGKWEHTLNANQERIQQEKRIGYNIEEYLIDDALKGIWKVNINYKGNKKLTPTYLKTTVYYNYGSPSQSKEIKVFKLQAKGLNQNLLRIQNGSLTAAR